MSVCGTGLHRLELSGFSWEHGYLRYRRARRLAVLSGLGRPGGFAYRTYTYPLQPRIPSRGGSFTSPSPHRSNEGYWNVDQLPIGIALRLSLRSRLTLIRLALIRKPWSIGVRVSRPHYRYLCLHLLFQTLQGPSQAPFAAVGMLPYLPCKHGTGASAAHLMPGYYRCPVARPVSCYALFK